MIAMVTMIAPLITGGEWVPSMGSGGREEAAAEFAHVRAGALTGRAECVLPPPARAARARGVAWRRMHTPTDWLHNCHP